ncbi:hypothetical protein RM780_10305 [Streptomyces sp. DSM 44917]|uniref:Uncharacterized protein n=1 Tax=Streptomyces boetiae TaxID=3075541 RepID=A0ABU2L704_9ACTN|nr:hypothetical protein [Streptomyces sp. DSM 44917]MDT0307353.1 hypothetical protein [Streptomyces sp. DSM 44917]
MTESDRRLVTVPTWGGGMLVMPEPEWCAGHHTDHSHHPGDFQHSGPDIELTLDLPRGERVLLRLGLGLRPLDEGGAHDPALPYMAVEVDDDWHNCDPDALLALADQMTGHIEEIRKLASELAKLRDKTKREAAPAGTDAPPTDLTTAGKDE